MNTKRNDFGPIETDGKLKKTLTRIKPVAKRIAKCTAIICVSLTISSLGAVANETCNKAGAAAKAAKSAKSSSKTLNKAAKIGSAIIVCANAGAGAEDIVTNQLSKPYKLLIMGTVFICGLMCGQTLREDG